MKKVIVSAFAVALLAGVLSLSRDALSQNGPAKEPVATIPHKVGLIDMAFVFKNYKKFENRREELKTEIAGSEDQAKELQKGMVDLQAKLKQFGEGTAEFTKIEKQYVQQAADFENFRRSMSREFLKKESQIYLEVYNDVSKMVEKYALHFKYTLIIRFNREDLDTENPQQLLQGMNRQVVYYRGDDDITSPVLESLNKKLDSPTAKPAPRSAKESTSTPSTPR